jgi:hypothetical protein
MSVLLGENERRVAAGAASVRVVLDLEALGKATEAEPLLRYLRTIILERGDFNGRVLSIRRDDLRALCAISQTTEDDLFSQLEHWGALLAGRP